jgi:hypothetical protein
MAPHPRDLEPNGIGLTTGELPTGALYRNYDSPNLEMDPPMKVLDKLDDGGIVVQELDPESGAPAAEPMTLEPTGPGEGGWDHYEPQLIALPGEDAPAEAPPDTTSWQEQARESLYRTRWQIGYAAAAGVAVAVITAAAHGEADYTPLGSVGEYLGFALGISSVLALVASITFGFLLHHIQSVTGEKQMLYGRFKAEVDELRRFLDSKYEAGIIDRSYDYPLGYVEQITLKDFPLMDFGEIIEETLKTITEEQREELEAAGEFGPILRGVAWRVNDIEETVNGMFMIFVKEVGTIRMLAPVVKAFQTLAVVIFAVLVALADYGGILKTVLFAAAVGLGAMSMLLVLELALVARREARELHGMSLLDDKR